MARVDVYYNCPSVLSNSWSSGSTRLELTEIPRWLLERTAHGKAVLITDIVAIDAESRVILSNRDEAQDEQH